MGGYCGKGLPLASIGGKGMMNINLASCFSGKLGMNTASAESGMSGALAYDDYSSLLAYSFETK